MTPAVSVKTEQRLSQAAEGPRAELAGPGGEAELLGDGKLWLAQLSPLGGDDDNPVGGLGAINRGCRSTLEDLYPLNVFRVEIGNAIDRVILISGIAAALGAADRVLAVGNGHVADYDPIHHEQRIHTAIDGRHAAQVELHATTGRSGVGLDVGAWNLALKRALKGLRRCPVELLARDGGNRIREILSLDAGGLAGDDDLLELEDIGVERYIGPALGRGHATCCRL